MQFEQTLSEFELVKKKIAYMAAHAFAMEATTAECASFIDRGFEDYMLETAMLKVWSTEALWQIVNDTLQIYGGKGFFTDEPYERMMRDARLNQIGEGANDVLRAFIAVVGMRGVGEHLKGVLAALKHPWSQLGTLWKFGRNQLAAKFTTPEVPVKHASLHADAHHWDSACATLAKPFRMCWPICRKQRCKNANGSSNEEILIIGEVMKRQYLQDASPTPRASCTHQAAR